MEVQDRKELLKAAMSAPGKAWKNAREALDGLGSLEIGSGLALEISDIPRDALETQVAVM